MSSYKKSSTKREWLKAVLIAIVSLILLKIFAFQSFVVSDSKMSSTLYPGDYIIINKLGCGARLPITLLSFPFTGNTFPFSDSKAYSKLIQLPYIRIPGFSGISRNDLILFNYPPENVHPIDKKTQMLKRCVALPADTLAIIDKKIFINGVYINDVPDCNYRYRVISENKLTGKFYSNNEINEGGLIAQPNIYNFFITRTTAKKLLNDTTISQVNLMKLRKDIEFTTFFPQSKYYGWSLDYFGAVIIPAKGKTILLNYKTIDIYKKVIEHYEDNKLIIKDNKIFINDKETTEYTFKMDYYFMLDDNRDNGKDSRYWGFVPENHIIGKASFILFSIWKSNNYSLFKWNRIFKILH
ncbi:MAG: signal peptidase I [Bacteroidetes bacterium CG23_combo_of_CG06-09_8_20_14_all_32_9]|nr:MAG: signal peptidase I [Bacteroidetes bacterium CG23_combo_of_CG06-09_8_20_14_all_32_9]